MIKIALLNAEDPRATKEAALQCYEDRSTLWSVGAYLGQRRDAIATSNLYNILSFRVLVSSS